MPTALKYEITTWGQVKEMNRAIICTVCVTLLSGLFTCRSSLAQTDSVISLDPGTTYQTMSGWEAIAWASNESPAFGNFIDEVLHRSVHEVGINRIRLEVRAGVENTRDYWTEYQEEQIEYADWRCNRYATVNDDADPEHIEWEGFHFSELDWVVEHIANPLRDEMADDGQALYINVNYVAFTGQIQCGGQYLHDDAQEYAEFVLATYLHLEEKYGWVPDAWEILLEPDNVSQWNGALIGHAVVEAAARLEANGFTPRFIVPSTTNMGNASRYFDDMVAATPECLPYVMEVCYHRYGGVSAANLQAIVNRAVSHGLNTSMLEWWNNANTYATLHEDLKQGRNSAWQRGVFAGVGNVDASAKLFAIDGTDPLHPEVNLNHGTKYLRQYFLFVRPGAVRIGASATPGSLDPLAFVHPDGSTVVVVKATAATSFSVENLSAGLYGIKYTTGTGNNRPTAYDVDHPDVILKAAETLDTNIPGPGVITIYQKPSEGPQFVRGDCNGDGEVGGSVTDAVFLLLYLFTGGRAPPCLAACDVNADGQVTGQVTDAVYYLTFSFLGGPPPAGPFPECGPGSPATDAALGCETPPEECL